MAAREGRNDISQVSFHVGTQTLCTGDIYSMSALPAEPSCYIERQSQTNIVNSQYQSTCRDASTQMTKRGIFISSSGDKTVIARTMYQSSDAFHALRDLEITKIQCCFRSFVARKKVALIRGHRARTLARALKQKLKTEDANLRRAEFVDRRRVCPKTRTDFEINEIEWGKLLRQTGLQIKSSVSEGRMDASLVELKRSFSDIIRRGNIVSSKPEAVPQYIVPLWLVNGEVMEVVNEIELKKFEYLGRIFSEDCSPTDRLNLVTGILNETNFRISEAARALLERERELLLRERPMKSMQGLRRRVYCEWLKFIS